MVVTSLCSMKKRQAFGCTNNLLLLPVSGAFVILLGVLLFILYLVTRGLTTSLHFIEGPIPNFVPAIVLICSGAFTALLYIKPARPLIFVSFVLGLACIILCSVQAITTLVIYLPFLNSLSVCVEKPTISECQCYIVSGNIRNKTIVTDDSSVHYTFEGTATCQSIERTLKDFLYVICIVYVFGLVSCLFTTVLSILLWCWYRSPEKEVRGTAEGTTNDGETAVAGSSAAASGSGDPASQQSSQSLHTRWESSSDQARVEEVRTVSTGRNESQRRRPTVQRSSSITTGQSNPAPRITRHHSVATADTSPPDQNRPRREGNTQGRPRMPHILIRGGYLQSQLDGPTIPVYTLQGSNEAYISLTDLPSLQMPSLDSVPAFIPELPEPVPDEEPPPYSPEPHGFSPQQEESDSIPPVNDEGEEERCNTEENLNADDHVQQTNQDTDLPQDSGNAEGNVPSSARSDHPPSSITTSPQHHSPTLRPDSNESGAAREILDETSYASSVPNVKNVKSVRRKTSRSQPHAERGSIAGGKSTSPPDGSRSEGSLGLQDGKKKVSPKYGNVKEEQKRPRKDRERVREVGNTISTIRDVQNGTRIKTGGSDSNKVPLKNSLGDETTGGLKPGDKGRTGRRKALPVPGDNPGKNADKKQRIKEQVVIKEKSRPDRKKPQSESDENFKKTRTKAGSHLQKDLPDTQTETEEREKPLSSKNASGAKPKVRRKQRGPSVEDVKNLEKISNGSSHESLSEIVSLLESVKGGQEKKSKRKRSLAVEELNIPDSHV